MDVLKPPLIFIEGRCYRRNPAIQCQELAPYVEEDEYADTDYGFTDDVNDDYSADIQQTQNGYRLSMSIPSAYFKYIIGKKGETKKRLENETRTQIRIPKIGQEGDIVINGRDKKGVASAQSRINILVDSARAKQPFTHFLSIPINFENFQKKFTEFKESVLKDCKGNRGIDETIFQNPLKLHLTMGTLALMNKAEIDHACKVLEDCQQSLVKHVVGSEPMIGMFNTLEYMNDDPNDVDVLYCMVNLQDGSNRLQKLADMLVERFISAGLMFFEYDHVKIHVTLMNTLMRKDPSGALLPTKNSTKAGSVRDRESFDASQVLRHHEHFDFGLHRIETVHLSKRYATACDGYYQHETRILLP